MNVELPLNGEAEYKRSLSEECILTSKQQIEISSNFNNFKPQADEDSETFCEEEAYILVENLLKTPENSL